ncbi:MAG: class I SAM-dependent methyltransferase [Scytolyngbya sp. HA4215-MV1]|jgi:SAM-dependent methyltransferase|nr:class I SAM-dependent methyltransferase [Scytolyngbya sp. HA4215-MV1]
MTPLSFKDYFSKQAGDYARYRPHYPETLFTYLASLCPHHDNAWDCATGNGQVALSLAPHFQQIYATDASAKQIAQTFPHDRIHYTIAPAEASQLPDQSMDLITVGQALHWFNLEAFYTEVRRVAKPTAILAVWCYDLFTIPQAPESIQIPLQAFHDLTEPFWPPERELVNQRYQTIPFPFTEITAPPWSMQIEWTIDHLLGYLFTWSATQRYIEQNGLDQIAQVSDRLKQAWHAVQPTQLIQWSIPLRVGKLDGKTSPSS